MSYIDREEIIPQNKNGLENYKFVTPFPNTIYVYHLATYKSPFGRITKDWLCCTGGWRLREDEKWHETVCGGWEPDRIADTLEDIFNYYRNRTK